MPVMGDVPVAWHRREPLARLAGLVVTVIGSLGMAGWLLDIDRLRQLAPGQVSMRFNTAACLVLLGLTLAVGASSHFAAAASATVGTVAAVTLVEYATGWASGLEGLLFEEADGSASQPGRMAATTALCLGLGVVAVMGVRQRRTRVVTAASRVIFLLSWVGCLGYAFGVRALYELGPFSAMAGHTAAALLVLSLGLLLASPDGPLSWVLYDDDPGAAVLRRTLPLGVFGLPAFATLCLAGQRAELYGVEAGLAIIVLGSALLVILVAVSSAKVVVRLNGATVLANDLLRATNSGLEASVAERTDALAASEARARAIADAAPVGIFHTDAEGRATYVNQRWLDIVGRSAADALGSRWITWVDPEDLPRVLGEQTLAAQNGVGFDGEFRVVQPSGAVRWVRVHSASATGGGDPDMSIAGTMDDITVRVEAQQARRSAEAMFRTTFDASPVAMAIVDQEGNIDRANPALAALTGFSMDELARRSLQSLLDPDDDYRRTAEGEDARDHRLHRRVGIGWASIHAARIDPSGQDSPALDVVQLVDTTARVELEHRLADLAAHDPLTGLRNRRSFETALTEHAAHCRRHGAMGSLLLLDLDHFKQVNDTFGHEAGDRALIAFTTMLVQTLRETDVIARLGGDEFAVLLPEAGPSEAQIVAASLVERVRAAGPAGPGDAPSITLSVGISSFGPGDRPTDEVLADADRALYEAKALGRDRWAVCTPLATR